MIMADTSEVSRQWLVATLRRVGMESAAEAAARELPNLMPYDQAAKFCEQHGISLDDMISDMGGSP
jgi:hypothetical protein